MKKVFQVMLSAFISCIIHLNSLHAQSLAIASAPVNATFATASSNAKTIDYANVATARNNSAEATKAMKANFKAVKNLQKQFNDLSGVKWINYGEVIMARFDKEDIQTCVSYNKKGQWLHTVSYYDVNKIPKDIKVQVEKTFPEYNVTGASEIKEEDLTFYLVYIENCTSFKQISVANGELAIYKEYRKNN